MRLVQFWNMKYIGLRFSKQHIYIQQIECICIHAKTVCMHVCVGTCIYIYIYFLFTYIYIYVVRMNFFSFVFGLKNICWSSLQNISTLFRRQRAGARPTPDRQTMWGPCLQQLSRQMIKCKCQLIYTTFGCKWDYRWDYIHILQIL